MKTIAFFSEKGGVGKSSFTIMYASWLQKHGVRVGVADFNNRITAYRMSEIRERNKFIEKNPDAGIQPFNEASTWPIANAYESEIEVYRKDGSQFPYANWFKDQVQKGKLNGLDVVLCDFPGSLSGGEFKNLLILNQLGLIVIPTEKDQMTLQSTYRLSDTLKKLKKNFCCFVNKAQLGMKNYRGQYTLLGRRLAEKGIPMLPDIITYSERMMTIDKVDIIRSTFGFPDFSKGEYKRISDLGIENLFIDITRELNKSSELENTEPVMLDFVNEMQKKDDGRCFKGSSFPEYE